MLSYADYLHSISSSSAISPLLNKAYLRYSPYLTPRCLRSRYFSLVIGYIIIYLTKAMNSLVSCTRLCAKGPRNLVHLSAYSFAYFSLQVGFSAAKTSLQIGLQNIFKAIPHYRISLPHVRGKIHGKWLHCPRKAPLFFNHSPLNAPCCLRPTSGQVLAVCRGETVGSLIFFSTYSFATLCTTTNA